MYKKLNLFELLHTLAITPCPLGGTIPHLANTDKWFVLCKSLLVLLLHIAICVK